MTHVSISERNSDRYGVEGLEEEVCSSRSEVQSVINLRPFTSGQRSSDPIDAQNFQNFFEVKSYCCEDTVQRYSRSGSSQRSSYQLLIEGCEKKWC